MKKTQGRKASKAKSKTSKNAPVKAKKSVKKVKKKSPTVKGKTRSLLSKAKKRMSDIKKSSSKGLHKAAHKAHATEEEILKYVKENPVKSISAVALTGLIAGFLTRLKK